ncbi:MAG: KpsF/GutQ family sugar-phosphate isomerase [Paludibacter sp.]|nr:KpsF/GutQ family sugar-phosphate isomerase [Paludibacter sp.]
MDKYISNAIKVIDCEISALEQLKSIVGSGFIQTIEAISSSKGRVVITGVGKSGHIARKIAATMASLGTPSFFLHPDDAMHGDLGMITRDDIVLAISNSGESEELLRIIPNIKLIGALLISITNNEKSKLAIYSEIICPIPKVEEAGSIKMAPTSSTTVTLALGDALAVVLSEINKFKKDDFAIFHPAGAIGKRLTTTVADIMHSGDENATVLSGTTIKSALFCISSKYLGAAIIVDASNKILGLITDGDIRRCMDRNIDIHNTTVDTIMTHHPLTIQENSLAIDALMLMQSSTKRVSSLPVVDGDIVVGMITISDILKLGIVY